MASQAPWQAERGKESQRQTSQNSFSFTLEALADTEICSHVGDNRSLG